MESSYTIEPRVKKRWFKENEMHYDLVKHSEELLWCDPSYGNGDGHFISATRSKTVFSSKNIEELITIKNNLER